MKKKILSHTGFMIVLTAILTFIAASFLMYEKFDDVMKRTVRDETEYVKAGMEKAGEDYLSKRVGDNTGTRITLTDENGKVLYDSEADASKLPNHSNRPEFVQAMEEGHGEVVRYSETLAQQTFYYAVKLDDGKILRLAKTTDSVFHTLMSSLIWLGFLMIVIILIEIILVQRQTKKLIKPINSLDLEHPLDNVCYEELKPLLTRVDQQNLQIACQLEELVSMESVELNELAEDVVNNLQDQAQKKNISLRYYGHPVTIQGVRHVLYEMLYNIADNAVRYTNPDGHIYIYVGKNREGKAYYRVEDDGIGIPKSEQKRIFERFYRVDKSHSRQTGGTGLGLSIVKHGATLHHAQIHVDSDLGKGTKMELRF